MAAKSKAQVEKEQLKRSKVDGRTLFVMEFDPIKSWANENCNVGSTSKEMLSSLFMDYCRWCSKSGLSAMVRRGFFKKLRHIDKFIDFTALYEEGKPVTEFLVTGIELKKNFQKIGAEIGILVAEKNAAYGDSFAKSGEIMRILYPAGIEPEQMDDALAVVRVVDKLFRIATRKDAFGESPWKDIAGYGILGAAKSTFGTSVPQGGLRYGEEAQCVPRDSGHPGDDGAADNG
jgi:hypothetical protein